MFLVVGKCLEIARALVLVHEPDLGATTGMELLMQADVPLIGHKHSLYHRGSANKRFHRLVP